MSEFKVEREVRIAAPASQVYPRLADFHRWSEWSPFEELDPNMERSFSGSDSGVGAVYQWSGGMKVGSGRMEITEAEPDRRVVLAQRNEKPFKSQSTSTFSLDESGEGTLVTWSTTGELGRMARLMSSLKSMDQLLGPVFEKGLAKLKSVSET